MTDRTPQEVPVVPPLAPMWCRPVPYVFYYQGLFSGGRAAQIVGVLNASVWLPVVGGRYQTELVEGRA